MSTDVVVVEPEHAKPDIDALAQQVGSYRNGAYLLLMAWLSNPGLTTTQALKEAGISRVTYQRYRRTLDGFPALVDYIRDSAISLKMAYAKQRIENAIPELTDAMIERGTGTAKDSQRAGEKLLESVGVLTGPEPAQAGLMDGLDSLELLAIRVKRSRA